MQGQLFPNNPPTISSQKTKIGQASVNYSQASSILTPGKGFLSSYDYSLNPYSGCSFGCNYCYAAFFAFSKVNKDNWGYWVKVKDNALQLLAKWRKKPLIDKTIYLSSVTDPYQPIESTLQLTRQILQELLDYHQVKLVVQTRSSLITRDIDLLQQFNMVQVNMTITTDDENVRKAFEPLCPSNPTRLKAIITLHQAGIESCITMTPLLPVSDAHQFAQLLKDTGIQKFIVQDFHIEKGKFVANTREDALKMIEKMQWTSQRYAETVEVLKKYLPTLAEGKDGFSADKIA
ncbi:MAG TPA: radical SAM protein [Microscillaceae bacterium]|nr:radical SAM protein [Microscillaceae bacterium]